MGNITSHAPAADLTPDDTHQKQLFADFYDDLEAQFGLDLASAFASAISEVPDPDQIPDPDQRASLCQAAIRLEPRFATLRYRLVPGRIGEYQFWTQFLIKYDEFSTRITMDLSPDHEQHQMSPVTATSNSTDNKAVEESGSISTIALPKVEVALLTVSEVFVYQIPARRDAQGHYAQSWGLEKPLWSGAVRLISSDDYVLVLRLYDPASGEVFADSDRIELETICRQSDRTHSARIKAIQFYIEPTLDTSRYFVVRFKNPVSGQIAFLGIGFRHRSSAFDLNASVLDQLAKCERFLSMDGRIGTTDSTSGSISRQENAPDQAELESTRRDVSVSTVYQLFSLPGSDQEDVIPPALSPPKPQYLYHETDDEDNDSFGSFIAANQSKT